MIKERFYKIVVFNDNSFNIYYFMPFNELIKLLLVYKMVYFSYLIYRCWISYTCEWSMWVFVRGPVFISIFVRVLDIFDIHIFTYIVYHSIDKSFENIKRSIGSNFVKIRQVTWSGERGLGGGGFILLSIFWGLYFYARSNIPSI